MRPAPPRTDRRWSAALARWALVLAPLLALAPTAARAQGPAATCVEVITARPDGDALTRLVRTEVDRHPTHRVVDTGSVPANEATDAICPTHLRVELIEVKEGRFITGRINDAVPHRERIEGADSKALETALGRMLTIVLHNDPVRLYGPDRDSFLSRAGTALRRRGENLIGAEASEATAYVDGALAALPGFGLVARREVDDWMLGIRLSAAFDLSPGVRGRTHLTMLADAGLDVTWFMAPLADSSFFAGGELALQFQHYKGPARLLESGATGSTTAAVFGRGGRAGYEMFRTSDLRMDVFARLVVPVMKSSDQDSGVINQWVPTAGIGAAVLF